MLTRDQILQADDLPYEDVDVPEWGGAVRLRSLTGAERDAFETSIVQGNDRNMRNIRARLVVLCIVDDEGNRVFKDNEAPALGKKSAKALDTLFAVAQKLNGLSNDDVDDLAKNSPETTSDELTSD